VQFHLTPFDDDSFSASIVKLKIGNSIIANEVDDVSTHGAVSHFIKHGLDFPAMRVHWHEASYAAKKILLSSKQVNLVNKSNAHLTDKEVLAMGKEATGCILDLINDRVVGKQEIHSDELRIYEHLETKAQVFAEFIAISIEEIKKKAGDNENYWLSYYFDNRNNEVYYRKSDTGFFATTDDTILTAFCINKSGQHNERVIRFFNSKGITVITDKASGQVGDALTIMGAS